MKILCIACIHAEVENLFSLIDKLKEIEFDLIVIPGDFTDAKLPKGFSKVELAELIIEELKTLKKPLIAVPGSWDDEIIDFLEEKKISIHEKNKAFGDLIFYGFGGARTPFGTPFEPSEEEIEAGLRKALKGIENYEKKVQVTHMPPFNTKIDVVFSGMHVGSETIRKFIEEFKPILSISSHIHEAKGVDFISSTTLINPGRFTEGNFGIVEIEGKKVNARIEKIL